MADNIFHSLFRSPFDEVDRFNRLLGSEPALRKWKQYPPVNAWMGEDEAVLTAEISGIDPEDLDISVKNASVKISGTRDNKADTEENGENQYLRRERHTGNFVRTFILPIEVNPDKVQAEYRRGILELTFPRSEEEKPKKIKVSS